MTGNKPDAQSTDESSLGSPDFVESSRIVVETASDAVITIDQDSKIIFVNRGAVKIFGYSIEEMIGSSLTMLMPEYLRHVHRAGLKNYLETGRRHISWEAIELPGLHKNGKQISLELSFGEFQKDGHPFFTGIARDISKRKQNEKQLALQYAVTEILSEAATLDAATPRLLEAICKNLGWPLAALWLVVPGQSELRYIAHWREQSHEALSEFDQENRNLSFRKGEGLPGQVWQTKKSLWVPNYADEDFLRSAFAARRNLKSAFAFPVTIHDDVRAVIELFATAGHETDESMLQTLAALGGQIGQFIERKNTEAENVQLLDRAETQRVEAEAVARQVASLQKIMDAAFAHLTVDEVIAESLARIREVLRVDTVAILLLETKGDELVAWAAQGLEEEVAQGVRIPVGAGFAGKVVAQARPIIIPDVDHADVYNPLLRKKGVKSLLGVPLLVEGRPTGVLHVGTLHPHSFSQEDVHLLQLAADRIAVAIENARLYQLERLAREEAESANRAKDEFLTILSHELRTPLTPIIGWVHMMENAMLPQADFDKALSVVNRNAYNLKRLINDLLDMSAILSGKMSLEQTVLNLTDVLTDAVDNTRSYADACGVGLVLDIPEATAGLQIEGDRSRLNQVFCNLLNNAIKFSPAAGVVKVLMAAEGPEALVQIADRGEGISKDFLPHLFERFRQADGSRTRTHGGLGLGLALVKSFVEAHGGTVNASSEGVGRGSVFTVRLPRVDIPSVAIADATDSTTSQADNRKKILIVEDQPDTLEMLAATFRSRGFAVTTADSAEDALQMARCDNFDILVSDIAMPVMDGLELIGQLRKTQGASRIPAIALSGYAATSDADKAIAAGFDVHISKPVDPTNIVAAVEKLLGDVDRQKS